MTKSQSKIDEIVSAGVHFGYTRPRRHPSAKPFILSTKNRVDIIDPEKIEKTTEKACEFVKSLAQSGKIILFVGSKPETKEIVKKVAEDLAMPYVNERWIGGTLTNFQEIKKRIDKLANMLENREKGKTEVYTKKERLLMDREIARLEKYFSGLSSIKNLPAAVFVVDSKEESIAVEESRKMKIPVVSLSNSDCNLKKIDYPIVGNDSSKSSIGFIMDDIVKAYKDGVKAKEENTK